MQKAKQSLLKASLLGFLVVGIVTAAGIQTSAFPSFSTDPSDPKTCLQCHPEDGHDAEPAPAPTPGSGTTAPVAIPDYKAVFGPVSGSESLIPGKNDPVVWKIKLETYSKWDEAWASEGKAQLPAAWDAHWK